MPWWAWIVVGAAAAVGIYWLLVLTEGAYLGPKAVLALYDRYASRYDRTKGFDLDTESLFLGRPLSRVLAATAPADHSPVLLDVATGTARLPLAVLQSSQQQVEIVALDGSLGMLRQAKHNLRAWSDVILVHGLAEVLPFSANQFDAVTCLEALEFMPDSAAVLAEMWRVLRPGGILMTTNRTGWQSYLMPGKSLQPQAMVALIESLGAAGVDYRPWQIDYDLITAYKPGACSSESYSWPNLTACIRCSTWPLHEQEGLALICPECGWKLEQVDGIWQDA